MIIKFDKFKRARKPNITLCNPNGEELYTLSDSAISNRQLTLRFNSISEFTFTSQEKYPDGKVCEFYDYLKATRLVKIDNIAVFTIARVVETDNGIYKTKSIECKTLEYEISQKQFTIDEGTYKFYDPIDNYETILGMIMGQIPDWILGSVDSELWNLYRTFEVTEVNLYDFMVSNVEEAYECVFIFDSLTKTVSVKAVKNAVKPTEIYLSHKNLVKETTITEDSDELRTALSVYGADDLSIHTANPLGGSTIYDFSYYKNTDWMPQELIDALDAWELKTTVKQGEHKSDLIRIKALTQEKLLRTTELKELQGELKSLENIKAVRMEQGLDFSDINVKIASKEIEIIAKENQIRQLEETLSTLNKNMSSTSSSLSFENNFTEEQIKMLIPFIKIGSYQNENFALTDNMDDVERIELVEELMNMGKEVLARVSQPKLSFQMKAVNFLNLVGYKKFIQELELGSEITYEMRDSNKLAYPVLLEMSINYDNDTDITVSFGNRLRLDRSDYTFAELFKETINTVGDVNFNKGKWGEGVKVKNQFTEYLSDSRNASLHEIVNSDNQDILIDGSGIRCRRYNPDTETYDPEQMWITGKAMVFTDDAFQTAKTAIGNIILPDKTRAYGINAEVLLGNLIAGSQLQIMNGDKSFVVDESGVTIKNANILITNEKDEDVTLGDIYNNSVIMGGKLENVINSDGELISGALAGNILAGRNNIICLDSYTGHMVKLNEKGIIFANSKDAESEWEWKTAISAQGIEAEAIRSNGVLSGVNILGGTLDIGDGSFTVSSIGDVKITKGSIDLGSGAFTVNNDGDVVAKSITLTGAQVNDSNIVGGSLNIGNGKFLVDKYGNCNMSGSLTLGGDINITGAIQWGANSSPVKVLYSVDGETEWHEEYTEEDIYAKYSYDGGTTWTKAIPISSSAKLPEFITSTYIDATSVQSPIFKGGLIEGCTIRSRGTDRSAIEVYNDTDERVGYIKYDNGGNGTTEGARRMFFCTEGEYNMKLQSAQNMSLSGEKIYIEGKLIVNGVEYGGGSVAVFG